MMIKQKVTATKMEKLLGYNNYTNSNFIHVSFYKNNEGNWVGYWSCITRDGTKRWKVEYIIV